LQYQNQKDLQSGIKLFHSVKLINNALQKVIKNILPKKYIKIKNKVLNPKSSKSTVT